MPPPPVSAAGGGSPTNTSTSQSGHSTPSRRHSRPPPISRTSTIRSRDSSTSPNGPTSSRSEAPSILESFEPPELYDHPLSRDNSDNEQEPAGRPSASVASLRSLNFRSVSGQSAYSSLSSLRSRGTPAGSRRPSRSPAPTSARSPGLPHQQGQVTVHSLNTKVKSIRTKMPKTVDSGVEIRSPLFEDHVPSSYLPGSLHHASEESINRLIARQGAVALVRQLAEDLAMRDKELVKLRRRTAERERTLKKMLMEVDVSHMDIERRLAACAQKAENEEASDPETLDDMLSQAMSETDLVRGRQKSTSPASSTNVSEQSGMDLVTPKATLRLGGAFAAAAETREPTVTEQPIPQKKGWGSFLWGTKPASRKSGGSSAAGSTTSRRKPLHEDLFAPDMARDVSTTSLASEASRTTKSQTQSRTTVSASTSQQTSPDGLKSTISEASPSLESETTWEAPKANNAGVTSWALKLVTGTAAASRKGPSSKASSTVERPNMNKRPSAKDDLQRIMKRSTAIQDTRKRRNSGSSFSGKAALSHYSPPVVTPPALNTTHPMESENLGPVEMDTILDPAAQPPTLVPSFNDYYPTDYLTDRFGFIYDKKQRVASLASGNSLSSLASHTRGSQRYSQKDSSSNASTRPETPRKDPSEYQPFEAKTPTTWKDLLDYPVNKVPVLDPNPVTAQKAKKKDAVNREETKSPPLKLMDRMTRPSISMPPRQSLAPIHSTGQLSSNSDLTSDAETETVKVLLGQLSDLHDSLQRDRIQKWNEFLKKVRAHRTRTEGDKTLLPESMIADGELIGVATVGNKGKGGRQKWKEFRTLVLGGIPVDYRWKIWTECSGASFLRVPGYYEDLLATGTDDPSVVSQIAMDINRTLTDNVFFRKGPGVAKLKQVLLAYARRNPAVGYCQGMNMITASLLLIMPTEEEAFWVLVSIVESILPKTYFEQSLLASRADQQVLKTLVRTVLPALHQHLQNLGVELEALTFQWFLSIFTDCLAAEALFRVWDVLLCVEGSTFLFQTALALLRLNEKALLECETAAGLYSYLNGNMTHQGISIDGLISASEGMKVHVRRKEIEAMREEAIRRELEAMGPNAGVGVFTDAAFSESPKAPSGFNSPPEEAVEDEAGASPESGGLEMPKSVSVQVPAREMGLSPVKESSVEEAVEPIKKGVEAGLTIDTRVEDKVMPGAF